MLDDQIPRRQTELPPIVVELSRRLFTALFQNRPDKNFFVHVFETVRIVRDHRRRIFLRRRRNRLRNFICCFLQSSDIIPFQPPLQTINYDQFFRHGGAEPTNKCRVVEKTPKILPRQAERKRQSDQRAALDLALQQNFFEALRIERHLICRPIFINFRLAIAILQRLRHLIEQFFVRQTRINFAVRSFENRLVAAYNLFAVQQFPKNIPTNFCGKPLGSIGQAAQKPKALE